MNARSIFKKMMDVQETDRRGAVRTITICVGRNKGKSYPYASKRQIARQTGTMISAEHRAANIKMLREWWATHAD